MEYADLLKRPLEAFKYLLGFSETGEVPMEHFVLQLDEVLVASSNEKHLAAFKELPDFASFKGRIELVRVPYLRRWKAEKEIYDAQVTTRTVGKHVAPHATEVAAQWAVLTRLKKPVRERYPADVREILEGLTPLEKMALYEDGTAPDRLSLAQARELKKWLPSLYQESDAYPNYEGRTGRLGPGDQDRALQRRPEPGPALPQPAGRPGGADRAHQGQERLRVPAGGGGGRLPRPRGVRPDGGAAVPRVGGR